MAALAVCAVTAAHAKTRGTGPILPTTPDDLPPEDPGLIALTVAEIKRLFCLVTRCSSPKSIACTGSGGVDVIKPGRNGSITAPDYAANQHKHDQINK